MFTSSTTKERPMSSEYVQYLKDCLREQEIPDGNIIENVDTLVTQVSSIIGEEVWQMMLTFVNGNRYSALHVTKLAVNRTRWLADS